MIRVVVVAVFGILVTVLVVACGVDQRTTSRLTTTANAAPANTLTIELAEVEKGFANVQIRRSNMSQGWAAEVRPGDVRDHPTLSEDLEVMQFLLTKLETLPASDKAGNLRSDIRTAMIEDCKLLLWVARTGKDIWALESFLRHAQGLGLGPENFKVKPAELRAEALVMAKQAIAELRSRIQDGSGDAIGATRMVLLEWQFTPAELGLTAEDVKSLSGDR